MLKCLVYLVITNSVLTTRNIGYNVLLNELLSLPRSGIYIINDYRNKIVSVGYSLDCIDSVSRNIKDIRDGSHKVKEFILNKDSLEFMFLEEVRNRNNLRIRCNYWIDIYRNMGYTVVSEKKVKYKFRSCVEGYKFHLYLVSSNNEKHKIGIFESKNSLDCWIRARYPGQLVTCIRYQQSTELVEYYNELYRYTGQVNPVKIKEVFFVN